MDLIARKRIYNESQLNLPKYEDGLSQRMDSVYGRREDGTAIIDGYRSPWVSRMIGKTTPNIPSLPTQLPYKPIDTFTPSDFARNNIQAVSKQLNKFDIPDPDSEGFARDNIQGTLKDLENKKAATMEKLGNVANVAGSAIQGGINMIQDFNSYKAKYSSEDLNSRYGTTNTKVGDEDIQLQNLANEDEIISEQRKENRSKRLASVGKGAATGASIGSAFGPIGTGVGAVVGGIGGFVSGLFGSSDAEEEQRKELERQRQAAIAHNDFRTGVAKTRTLNNDYVLRHGDTNNQRIFADGKLPVLDSAFGMISGKPNARVDKGEWIINTVTGDAHKVNRGQGDNALAYIRPEDTILSKKRGAADYFEETGDLEGAMMMNKKQYSCGKMPKYGLGKPNDYILNAAAHGLGGLIGLQQYLQAKNSDVYKPNTYVRNPYANRGLGILGSLRINPYPIMNQLRAAEARGNYALNNSGGLSGSQKYLGRIANVRNTQQSIADAMMKMQEQNNAYKSQYGNLLLTTGAQEAANMMNAMRADNDVYMRSHAARQQGMETGIYNMQNNLLSWLANYNKLNQFNRTMAVYQGNQDLERQKIKALFG